MALHDEPMQSCLVLVDTNLRIANELVWLSVVGRFQIGLLPISTQFPAFRFRQSWFRVISA